MGRSGEGFQGTRQTCRAKRCEAATKLQTKKSLPVLSQAPQGSILAFPPTQDRSQLAPVSSPMCWAGTGSHDSTFQHAWASRQCAVPWIWECRGEAAHPGPFVPHFEAVL